MLEHGSIEILWSAILELRQAVADADEPVVCTLVTLGDTPDIYLNETHLPGDQSDQSLAIVLDPDIESVGVDTVLRLVSLYEVEVIRRGGLSSEQTTFLQVYLPYCFLSLHARRLGRAVSISHFAQTLDGRIATRTGDSRWIGNEENLIHAHRMRALCDAILIGRGTLISDAPALTVRRVEGPDPERVVICSSGAGFDSLLQSCDLDIHVFGTDRPQPENERIRFYEMIPASGFIDPVDVLCRLYQEGIMSVYVEGGATTTSCFLQHDAIDIVQLHFAPIIMGRGITSISVPGIKSVADALQFESYDFYPVGDSYMFIGAVARNVLPERI